MYADQVTDRKRERETETEVWQEKLGQEVEDRVQVFSVGHSLCAAQGHKYITVELTANTHRRG